MAECAFIVTQASPSKVFYEEEIDFNGLWYKDLDRDVSRHRCFSGPFLTAL